MLCVYVRFSASVRALMTDLHIICARASMHSQTSEVITVKTSDISHLRATLPAWQHALIKVRGWLYVYATR